ncbi:hypothetical protein AB7C87_10470 [Natrarchaeobius sp. A-rgal3]|uniref:hypothetical protein n=1 Tax=Natrarchaeobius versutus TaxID=1679078 RepID=UPI00350FAAFB
MTDQQVATAVADRERVSDEIAQARALADRFRELARTAERGGDLESETIAVHEEFDRFGARTIEYAAELDPDDDGPAVVDEEPRREELSYLDPSVNEFTAALLVDPKADNRTDDVATLATLAETTSFLRAVIALAHGIDDVGIAADPLGTDAESVLEELGQYAAGNRVWEDVRETLADAIGDGDGENGGAPEPSMIAETATRLATAFDLVTKTCVVTRDYHADRLATAIDDAYGATDDVESLSAEPACLLPVRLETRFVDSGDLAGSGEPDELRLRIYPDQLHVDSHEPELTEAEVDAGTKFWARLYLGCWGENLLADIDVPALVDPELQEYVEGIDLEAYGDDEDERYEALKESGWDRLVERFGTGRAAHVVDAVVPLDAEAIRNLGSDEFDVDDLRVDEALLTPGTDGVPSRLTFDGADRHTTTWERRATAELLPDRWVAILEWNDGASRRRFSGEVVPRGLALDPAVEPGATGDEMEWLFDYDRALEVGMAISIPLAELPGFDPETDAIDSVMALGVRESTDPAETPAALAEVFDDHRYTDGLSLVEPGTATNLEAAPDERSPPAPTPADLEATADGALLGSAFGIGDGRENPFADLRGADGRRYDRSGVINDVLWPATLGYYLRQLAVPNAITGPSSPVAGGVGPSTTVEWLEEIESVRDHFVDYVRASGPFPSIRVGEIPYGVVATTTIGSLDEPKPAPANGDPLAERIAETIRRFEPIWSHALETSAGSIDPSHDEWDVLDVLERSGISHGARTGDRLTNATETTQFWADSFTSGTLPDTADEATANALGRLESLEATFETPLEEFAYSRAGYLEAEDADEVSIAPHQFVDEEFGSFVDVLCEVPVDVIVALSEVVSLTAGEDFLLVEEILEWAGFDLEFLAEADEEDRRAVLETFWDGRVPDGIRHGIVLRAIENWVAATDEHPNPADFFDDEAGVHDEDAFLDALTNDRLRLAVDLAEEYGDTGGETSLLRSLSRYATLQEYVYGRVRLGAAFEDAPASYPEQDPSVSVSSVETLSDELPEPILGALHGQGIDPGGTRYADLLDASLRGEAQAGEFETDAGSELFALETTRRFGDHLRDLGDLERSTLAALTAESLDTTSHRLDAWWTSLATRGLFERREIGEDGGETDLVVGGYGYVENLRPGTQLDDRAEPEFVHVPSGEHANTAALLRGGYLAADDEELESALSVDLSAERVRDAQWLLEGVRRGTDVGELLGARFERRLHEVTMEREDVNLLRWKHPLREEYPGVKDQMDDENDGADGTGDGGDDDGAVGPDAGSSEIARSDVLDGYALVRAHEADSFDFEELSPTAEGANLDSPSDAEIDAFERLIAELADDVDAVSDLLLAETTHQIARGDPDRGGASIEALERGEGVPEPDVTTVPRSETGVTHRHLLLFDPADEPETETPRGLAEPTLESWLASVLPDPADVECVASWWVPIDDPEEESGTDGQDDDSDGETQIIDGVASERAREPISLAELSLSALDLLALSGEHRQGRAELDARVRYHLMRRVDDPPAGDETIELEYRETDADDAVSFATALEVARSFSALLDETRSASGEDLSHPSEPAPAGYTDETASMLSDRADDAVEALESIDDDLSDPLEWLGVDTDDESDGTVDDGESLPRRIDSAIEAAETLVETDLLAEIDAALESVAADGDVDSTLSGMTESLFVLSPPGDPETTLAETPEETTISIEPESLTDREVLYELPERDEDLEGEPIQAEPIPEPPEIPWYLPFLRTFQTAYERLGELQSAIGAAADALAEPETLANYEDAAAALGEARMTFLEALDHYEMGLEYVEGGAYANAAAYAEQATALTGRADEALEAVADHAEETVDPISVDDLLEQELPDGGPEVTVWATDGDAWVEDDDALVEAAVSESATYDVSVDLEGVAEGSWTTVVVEDDDRLLAQASGYVGRPGTAVGDDLRKLAWLAWARDWSTEGEGADLFETVGVAHWDEVADLAETWQDRDFDADTEFGQDDLETLETAAGLTDEPGLEAFADEPIGQKLESVAAVWDRSVGRDAVDVSEPEVGPDEATYEPDANRPSVAVAAAETLADCTDDVDLAVETLEALCSITGETSREIRREEREWTPDGVDPNDPAHRFSTTQRRLLRWLYEPGSVDASKLATGLESLEKRLDPGGDDPETNVDDLVDEAVPSAATLEFIGDVLDALADELSDPNSGVPTPGAELATDAESARSTLETALDALAIAEEESVDETVRLATLELAREPLFDAGGFGIYGAIPESALGATVADEEDLATQAASLASKLENCLDAIPAASNVDDPPADRVEIERERLEVAFDGSVPVLASFVPATGAELRETFAAQAAALEDDPLAVETWFQRSAQVVERIADEREALSYAEALSGESIREFGVGQLPYRPDDEWIGLDGVEPTPGTVSIVAGFGPALEPEDVDVTTQLAGVFVDEWVEGVASETEDTAVALNYDAPGSRAPQSVLLAVPPQGGEWSLETLAETVEQTISYAKLRTVDPDDLEAFTGDATPSPWPPLPGAYYAEHDEYGGFDSDTDPSMWPERVAWHDHRSMAATRLHLFRAAYGTGVWLP